MSIKRLHHYLLEVRHLDPPATQRMLFLSPELEEHSVGSDGSLGSYIQNDEHSFSGLGFEQRLQVGILLHAAVGV